MYVKIYENSNANIDNREVLLLSNWFFIKYFSFRTWMLRIISKSNSQFRDGICKLNSTHSIFLAYVRIGINLLVQCLKSKNNFESMYLIHQNWILPFWWVSLDLGYCKKKIANEIGLHKKEALEKKDDAKLMTDKRASGAKKNRFVVS